MDHRKSGIGLCSSQCRSTNVGKRKSFQRQSCVYFFLWGFLLISLSTNFINLYTDSKKTVCRSFSNELNELRVKNEEVRTLKGVVSFLTQPAINPHIFTYISSPTEICANPIEMLFVIPSAPRNFWRRNRVRQGALGTFVGNSNGNAKLLFFLGKQYTDDVVDVEVQSSVESDVAKYNDIVQEDYDDSFHNLRFKAMSMLKWPSHHCRTAKYVVRLNDNVEFNIQKVLAEIQKTSGVYANFILGHRKENGAPVRSALDKMYISKDEYPERLFPMFIYGRLQAYPISTVELLYQASLRVKPIWLEDVFITGMCASHVDVALVNLTDDDYKRLDN